MTTTDGIRRKLLDHLAFGAIWALYAALVRRFWFLTDDAYISLRYMRNWGSGNGLRYNLGEHVPVEGYSNFLWVAWGAALEALGFDIELAIPVSSAICGSAMLYFVFHFARYRRGAGLAIACLTTAFLGLSAQFAVWSTSGLATVPYALLFLLTLDRLVVREKGLDPVGGGIAAVLMALVRVDGIYWVAVFTVLAVYSRRARAQPVLRPILTFLAIVGVGYGTYYGWRYSYFGLAHSSTTYAKVHPSASALGRGASYVTVQYLTSLSLLVFVPALVLALVDRTRRPVLGVLALTSLGLAAYSILVGGDFMTFGRFLVPSLGPNTLIFFFLLQKYWSGAPWRRAALVATILLAHLPAWDLYVVPHAVRARFHFRHNTEAFVSEHKQWWKMRRNGIKWARRGDALAAFVPEGGSVVLAAIGATGFRSGFFVYDRHGFVNDEIALLPRDRDGSVSKSPGHDDPVERVYFVENGYDPTLLLVRFSSGLWFKDLLDEVQESAESLREEETLSSKYVIDYVALPQEEGQEELTLIYVWRRIPDGVNPERVWKRVLRRLSKSRETGKVNILDMTRGET